MLIRDLKSRYPDAEPVSAAFLNPKKTTKKGAAPDALDWLEGLSADQDMDRAMFTEQVVARPPVANTSELP